MLRCKRWSKRIPVSFTSVSFFAILLPSLVVWQEHPLVGAESLFLPSPIRIERWFSPLCINPHVELRSELL
jgi:hypothetical protein